MIDFYAAWDGTKRKWRYKESERPKDGNGIYTAECYDCGKPYESIGDCAVPNDIWERINPTEINGAGILCANCIIERIHYLGIRGGVNATLW